MTQLVHADIFFFITSISVVVVTVGIVIILFYVIYILHDIRLVTKRLRTMSMNITEDVEALRKGFARDAGQLRRVVLSLIGYVAKRVHHRYTHKKKTKDKKSAHQP